MQKLPTRDDFEALAARIETALRGEVMGLKQEVTEITARVASLESGGADLKQTVANIQSAQKTTTDQVTQLMLLLDDLENHNSSCNVRIKVLPEATTRQT